MRILALAILTIAAASAALAATSVSPASRALGNCRHWQPVDAM